MIKKIINFILPVEPLPKDKTAREIVIEKDEESIEYSIKKTNLEMSITSILMLACLLSLTNGFLVINTSLYVCGFFTLMLYLAALFLLIYSKISTITTHLKQLIYVFLSLVSFMSITDFIIGILNFSLSNLIYSRHKTEVNLQLSSQKNFCIFLIGALIYFFSYRFKFKKFNLHMIQLNNHYHLEIIENVILSVFILYLILEFILPYFIMVLFVIICGIILICFLSDPLVNYRQYYNIQNAKNGLPFK